MSVRLPSEFAVILNLGKLMILQQGQLDEVAQANYFDENSPCHIYFVCRRPRITVDKDAFKVSKEFVDFKFLVQRQDKFENVDVKLGNPSGSEDIFIKSDYPFTVFQLWSQDEFIMGANSALFLQSFASYLKSPTYLDLEILYIGQSYGVDGARTAPDRLKSHSTLQGIYAEAMAKNPDSEVWLALASFEQVNLMMFDGRTKFSEKEKEEDSKRMPIVYDKLNNEGLNEQQKINFTEAALIRYFAPPYNKIYKDSFPNPAHSTYSECYDLDINSICIEMQTAEMGLCDFYSQSIPPGPWHMKDFQLKSREERKSMFDFV